MEQQIPFTQTNEPLKKKSKWWIWIIILIAIGIVVYFLVFSGNSASLDNIGTNASGSIPPSQALPR